MYSARELHSGANGDPLAFAAHNRHDSQPFTDRTTSLKKSKSSKKKKRRPLTTKKS